MSDITPQQQSSAHQDQARRSKVVKEMRKLDRTLKEVCARLSLAIAPMTIRQISSLKSKQTGGAVLLPDQRVKVSREDEVRQALLNLQQQHPEDAAAFASLRSGHASDNSSAAAVPQPPGKLLALLSRRTSSRPSSLSQLAFMFKMLRQSRDVAQWSCATWRSNAR
jgi:hypothetical protein